MPVHYVEQLLDTQVILGLNVSTLVLLFQNSPHHTH